MGFQFQRLDVPEVILIKPQRFEDARGFFQETYSQSDFAAYSISKPFVQENYSHSCRGVLRGLHYQAAPKAQGKLVMACTGRIFDVAVDIRQGSPTYRKWVGVELSADNGCMLFIPPGFAHGFCVLGEEAGVVYKVTEEYAPEYDRGVAWNDPEIGVQWPITDPLLSSKDAGLPFLRDIHR